VAGDTDDYMARTRGAQLADLRWHWGEAYDITWAGRFRATRLDDGTVLEAGTAEQLREMVRADYSQRPVKPPS
jgi:hypothetical protein